MSVARILLVSLSVELMMTSLFAWAITYRLDWSAAAMLLIVPATAWTWRCAMFAAEFWLAQRFGEDVPTSYRIGPIRWARVVMRETACSLAVFQWLQPFARWTAPWAFRDIEHRPATRPVVLLVHGLFCNAAVWTSMRRALNEAGYDVEVVNLGAVRGAIEGYTDPMHAAIESICARRAIDRLIVVAHSMGGLVMRQYLALHGDARIAHVVTIGTPHAGTWLAKLGRGDNVRDMRLGSDFLQRLETARGDVPYRDFTCLFTWQDNLVSPQRTATLPGATAIGFSGVGHLAMVFDRRVQRCVVDVVTQSQTRTERPAPAA